MTEGEKVRWMSRRMICYGIVVFLVGFLFSIVSNAFGLIGGMIIGWFGCSYCNAHNWFDLKSTKNKLHQGENDIDG